MVEYDIRACHESTFAFAKVSAGQVGLSPRW